MQKVNDTIDKYVILHFLFTIITICTLSAIQGAANDHFTLVTIYGIGLFLWILFSWYQVTKDLFNVYTILCMLMLLFYMGQPILRLFNVKQEALLTIETAPFLLRDIQKALIFLLISIACFHLGVLIALLFQKYSKKKRLAPELQEEKAELQLKGLRISGWMFLLLSAPFALKNLFENIYITLTQGYASQFETDFALGTGFEGGIPRLIAGFFPAALMMLLISSVKQKRRLQLWTVVSLSYFALSLIAGNRGNSSLFIVAILFVYNYAVKRFTKSRMIQLAIAGVLLIVVFFLVSAVRNIGLSSGSNLSAADVIRNSFIDKNPIFNMISEMGFTLIACTCVMVYCPAVVPFYYGQSYVNGVTSLVPNLFWDVHPAAGKTVDNVFHTFLFQRSGIGSSFIIEGYYNFSYYSSILMVVFGILVAILYYKMLCAAHTKNYFTIFLCSYASYVVLWYVRSDTVTFLRNFVYYAVVPIVVARLVQELIQNRRKLGMRT